MPSDAQKERLLDRAAESALVHAARQGDFDAFDQLVRHCERRVFTVSLRLLGNREDAENTVQIAFLKALEAIESFRGEASFCSWVSSIATRSGLDLLRARKRHDGDSLEWLATESEDEASIPRPGLLADWREDPSRSVERHELSRILEGALDRLPQSQRTVFVLRDIQGLSTEEAARELGITVGNAKVRLLRARLRLREILTETFGDEELVREHLRTVGDGGLAAGHEEGP